MHRLSCYGQEHSNTYTLNLIWKLPLLPLALRGRLRHGRHFTFMSATNDSAITLVSPSVNGSIVDEEHPFTAHGLWLQVLLADDFIEKMCIDLQELSDDLLLPKTYRWPERRLCITILSDEAIVKS